jgi:triacylglycerol esterase/lipase EstA (alpha/beta hydrolase family)
MEKIKV